MVLWTSSPPICLIENINNNSFGFLIQKSHRYFKEKNN